MAARTEEIRRVFYSSAEIVGLVDPGYITVTQVLSKKSGLVVPSVSMGKY